MACAADFYRFILFVLNFIFVLAGLGLIGAGVGIHLYYKYYKDAVPSIAKTFSHFPIIGGVGGAVIFVIAMLGCCGAWKRSVCSLHTYGILMIILFLLEVGVAIYAWIRVKDKEGLQKEIAKSFTEIFAQYYEKKHCKETVDTIQSSFYCCGVHSPAYWETKIPATCYPESDRNKERFDEGCAQKVTDWILKSMVFIYVLVSVSGLELVAGVLAICVACAYHNEYLDDQFYYDDDDYDD